jgi:SAM-dependent methyltransferase
MSSVKEHYENLLAKHYIWMTGIPFDEKVAEQRVLIGRIVEDMCASQSSGLALDLGCGPGFHSIALAQLGYSPVIAIDTSAELLKELKDRAGPRAIKTIEADLTNLGAILVDEKAKLAVCMGDTLTHLPSRSAVQRFFVDVFDKLSLNGIFAITYRDLTSELTGADRFIPVRSDEEKVMICFLEFDNADSVLVHDLVHLRGASGGVLEKSCYRKLRLSQRWVSQELESAGFRVFSEGLHGRFTLLIARKVSMMRASVTDPVKSQAVKVG